MATLYGWGVQTLTAQQGFHFIVGDATVPSAVLAASQQTIAWRKGVSGLTFSHDSYVLFDKARVD